MSEPITRRGLLSLIPGLVGGTAFAQKNRNVRRASEFVRFSDPTTEAIVVRLTSPAYRDVLPGTDRGFVSLKPRVLYCSSDRTDGKMAPFEIDLRNGEIRQLAETEGLDPASLSLAGDGRIIYFLDDSRLCRIAAGSRHEAKRPEILLEGVSAYSAGTERGSELYAIREGRLEQIGGNGRILAQDAGGPCLARPGGKGCLFSRTHDSGERAFWYAGGGTVPVLLASGRISNPYWAPDGSSLFFLRDVPAKRIFISELHEVNPEERSERCVAPTSQFASFSANRDASVFVGASNSKAQPNVILLLRHPQRELTLCEHGASNAAQVQPSFSPDSRRVYFQSDREGKPAIYSVNVEKLVEPT